MIDFNAFNLTEETDRLVLADLLEEEGKEVEALALRWGASAAVCEGQLILGEMAVILLEARQIQNDPEFQRDVADRFDFIDLNNPLFVPTDHQICHSRIQVLVEEALQLLPDYPEYGVILKELREIERYFRHLQ